MNVFSIPSLLLNQRRLSAQRCTPLRDSGSSSLAHFSSLLFIHALSAVFISTLFMVQPAVAATWPVSASELSASVGFHQSYTAGFKSYVHSGIDIPASAGMQISAPMAGTVRFTGVVPSGDSKVTSDANQKTMNAVSIELHNDRVITLMPFASINVKEGQAVSEGQCLGTLAASGDVSSGSPHLHMGYKQGGMYYDPMSLFGMSSQGSSAQEAPEAIASGIATEPVPMAEAFAQSSEAIPADAAHEAYAQQGQTATEQIIQEQESPSFYTIETGAYTQKAQQAKEEFPLSALTGAVSSLVAACADQLAGFVGALSALSKGTGIPLQVLVVIAAALALCFCAVLLIMFIKFAIPRIKNAISTYKNPTPQVAVDNYLSCI